MEETLKCFTQLPLLELSLRKLVVLLWTNSDILDAISNFSCTWNSKKWEENIEGEMKNKILGLELPKKLEQKMIVVMKYSSPDIRKWKKAMENNKFSAVGRIGLPYLRRLCWTSEAGIDYRKTAQLLVRCNEIQFGHRFEIASYYCLEEDIQSLLENIPIFERFSVRNHYHASLDLSFYFHKLFRGELSELDYLWRPSGNYTSFNQLAFEMLAKNSNKTATEYFFKKLTDEEKEASLPKTVRALLSSHCYNTLEIEKSSHVSHYLLSLMNTEQTIEILKAQPIDVLLCFLDWPRQHLFLENTCLVWTHLNQSDYGNLFRKMGHRYDNSGHNFPKLFHCFFQQNPIDLKNFFLNAESKINDEPAFNSLSTFFDFQDQESTKIMFNYFDAADRAKVVFNSGVFQFFFISMLSDKWNMVKLFLQNAALSKDDKSRLKVDFKNFLERRVAGRCIDRKFRLFFEFLDDIKSLAKRN